MKERLEDGVEMQQEAALYSLLPDLDAEVHVLVSKPVPRTRKA
jgi:hypothetical protein